MTHLIDTGRRLGSLAALSHGRHARVHRARWGIFCASGRIRAQFGVLAAMAIAISS